MELNYVLFFEDLFLLRLQLFLIFLCNAEHNDLQQSRNRRRRRRALEIANFQR